MSQTEPGRLLSERMMEAAAGVLGSMLIDEEAVGPMLQAVAEDDFRQPEYRSLFRAIRKPACQPVSDTTGKPMLSMAMAHSAQEICSPVDSSISSSRLEAAGLISEIGRASSRERV